MNVRLNVVSLDAAYAGTPERLNVSGLQLAYAGPADPVAIAFMINYPRLQDQKDRLTAHAANVLPVVSLIFAAGIFVGIP